MDIWWNKGSFDVRFANKSGSHHHGISWYRKNSTTVKACWNKLFWVRKVWTNLSRYFQSYLGMTWYEIMKIPFLAIFIQTIEYHFSCFRIECSLSYILYAATCANKYPPGNIPCKGNFACTKLARTKRCNKKWVQALPRSCANRIPAFHRNRPVKNYCRKSCKVCRGSYTWSH